MQEDALSGVRGRACGVFCVGLIPSQWIFCAGEPEGTLESHFESINNSLAGITGPTPPIGLKIGLTMRKTSGMGLLE